MRFPYFIFAFSEGGLVVQTKRTDTWLFLKKKIQTNTCKIAGDGNAETRERKDAMTPGCGDANMTKRRVGRTQGRRDAAGRLRCRNATIRGCRDAGMTGRGDGGARGWRDAGLPRWGRYGRMPTRRAGKMPRGRRLPSVRYAKLLPPVLRGGGMPGCLVLGYWTPGLKDC